MTRYVVQHVADPFEHHWEFHVVDRQTETAVAICALILFAEVICDALNAIKETA